MNLIRSIIATVVITAILVGLGMLFYNMGQDYAWRECRYRVIEAGVASWVVDAKTGVVTFMIGCE